MTSPTNRVPPNRASHPSDPVQLVTTAPQSASDELASRTRRYLITMSIRTFSFVAAAVTHGWVRWTFVALAVFLPYFAVVAANAVRPRQLGQVRPSEAPRPLLASDAHDEPDVTIVQTPRRLER